MATDDLPLLTTSARKEIKRCPQAWWWRFVDGYESLDESADALWFGIGVHEALAQWYKKGKRRGVHPATYFERWVGDETRRIITKYADRELGIEAQYEDAAELGIAMLEGYVERYGRDENWDVIQTEYPFAVRIKRKGRVVGVFKSTFDGVYRDENDGLIYLMEHKTAAQISLAYLQLDDQAGAYWAVATDVLRSSGLIGPRESLAGIRYNFLRKALPDEREPDENGFFHNKPQKQHYIDALSEIGVTTIAAAGKDGSVALDRAKLSDLQVAADFAGLEVLGEISANQGTPRFVRETVERQPRERSRQLQKVADEFAIVEALLGGTLPVTKTPTRDCTRCDFFIMCQLHDRGGEDWKEFADSEFRRVDPFARYANKSASE